MIRGKLDFLLALRNTSGRKGFTTSMCARSANGSRSSGTSIGIQ